jgi:hypothetical protein
MLYFGDGREDIEDAPRAVQYSDCFRKLFNRFKLCIDLEGDYFEYKE